MPLIPLAPDPAKYPGGELALFADARVWKAYWSRRVRPHLSGSVLEVGAGIGANTEILRGAADKWTCLEPDPTLCEQARGALPASVEVRCATTESVEETYDAVIYIDVLEHIEDDVAELTRAVGLLRPGGRLVVLSPAHPSLFSPFDAAIGHFRRYTKATLRAVQPAGTSEIAAEYLDSIGMAASFANRALLEQALPTPAQIRLWDRVLVRLSRVVDPLLGRRLGKTVLMVWRADSATVAP